MKNLNEDQKLQDEELSQVLGGASDTSIISENDDNGLESIKPGCPASTCQVQCQAGCSAGCSGMCTQTSGKDGFPFAER